MATARTRRRRARTRRRGSPRSPLLDPGELQHIRSWAGVAMHVQLPVNSLASGRLASMSVGDVLDVAPALYMSEYSPVGEVDEYFSDCDPVGDWWCSEAGAVSARGALIPPTPGNPGLQTFLLDIAGRAFPLNWTNPEPFLSPVIAASGGLYLDPRLEPDALLGPTGDWCRAPLRVTALRRYTMVDGDPGECTEIERVPDPWEVGEAESYVADLVEVPRRGS